MYANEYTHQPVYLQVHTALPLSRSLLYFAPDLVPRMCLYLGRCARVLYMNMLYILTYLVVRMRARVRACLTQCVLISSRMFLLRMHPAICLPRLYLEAMCSASRLLYLLSVQLSLCL